ncbi:MAG: phasin family protein [Pseudomonadota bacterium]
MATTAKAAVKRPAKAAEKTAETTPAADFMKPAEDFTATAKAQFEDATAQFSESAEEWREQAEDMAADMRARFEKQQQLAADVNGELMEAAKTEVADAVQFANDLGKAKTFADALEVQQAYFTNLFETRVARAQDMTSKTVELAKDAMRPAATDFGAFFDPAAYQKFFRFPTKA